MKYLFLLTLLLSSLHYSCYIAKESGYSDKYLKISYYPNGTLEKRVESVFTFSRDTITFYDPVTLEGVFEISENLFLLAKGQACYYYQNGQLMDSGRYDQGMAGEWRMYYPNGNIKDIRYYDTELRSIVNFDSNGVENTAAFIKILVRNHKVA